MSKIALQTSARQMKTDFILSYKKIKSNPRGLSEDFKDTHFLGKLDEIENESDPIKRTMDLDLGRPSQPFTTNIFLDEDMVPPDIVRNQT